MPTLRLHLHQQVRELLSRGNHARATSATKLNALILDALTSPNPILRCAAGEALGRMAQVWAVLMID